jgi:pyruvate dehydrogenase complex dehydrogenase (E1) component
MLNPMSKQRVSWVEKHLSGRKGPVIAATDYMKLYADQIRDFVPATFVFCKIKIFTNQKWSNS